MLASYCFSTFAVVLLAWNYSNNWYQKNDQHQCNDIWKSTKINVYRRIDLGRCFSYICFLWRHNRLRKFADKAGADTLRRIHYSEWYLWNSVKNGGVCILFRILGCPTAIGFHCLNFDRKVGSKSFHSIWTTQNEETMRMVDYVAKIVEKRISWSIFFN